MLVEVEVTINGSKNDVWKLITDIENAADTISGIDKIEILENPDQGLVGLKWRETRTMFGKAVAEIMWITEATDHEFYEARAESHGCIYTSTMSVSENDGQTLLKMTHHTKPQAFVAKVFTLPMGLFLKGFLRKAMLGDLNDIKANVENRAS